MLFLRYNRFYVLTYTVFCIGYKGPIYSLTGGLESYVRLMEQDETQITLFSARNITLALLC